MRFLFAVILFTFPLLSRADLQIQALQKIPSVEAFINEAQSYLPDAFNKLPLNKITVNFRKLDNFKTLQNPCVAKTGHQVYGMFENNTIVLNINFFPYLNSNINGPEQFPCGHKNYKRLAIATLLHELTHFYDRQTLVSQSYTYKALAGSGVLSTTGQLRSPDGYEYFNKEEHFAVNMEFYLLDEEYSCRRPNLNRFFNKLFKLENNTLCNNFPTISVNGSTKSISSAPPVQINISPSNVLEIKYIVAGNGQAPMSRFGHSMFKLVMKPPYQDLTVGFIGVVSDNIMSGYKGLTGKYPSKLSIEPYSASIGKYTQDELRLLSEYPLKLSSEQKEVFLQQVMTLYYEYTGRYYFITNNCATEAMNLLKGVYQNTAFQKEQPITPKGVLSVLKANNFIDEKNVLVIPSYWETLEKIFSKTQPMLPVQDLKIYWELTALERQGLIKSLLKANKPAYMSLLSLENTIMDRNINVLEKKLLKNINNLPENDLVKKASKESAELSNRMFFYRGPSRGYGIPLQDDYVDVMDSREADVQEKLNQNLQLLKSWGEDYLKDSEEFKEIQETKNNETLIKGILKKIKSP